MWERVKAGAEQVLKLSTLLGVRITDRLPKINTSAE